MDLFPALAACLALAVEGVKENGVDLATLINLRTYAGIAAATTLLIGVVKWRLPGLMGGREPWISLFIPFAIGVPMKALKYSYETVDWVSHLVFLGTCTLGAHLIHEFLNKARGKDGPSPAAPAGGGAKLLAVALLASLALGGCSAQEAYVRADELTYKAIAPEYVGYVEKDPALSDDEKARRKRTVETWKLRIDKNQ